MEERLSTIDNTDGVPAENEKPPNDRGNQHESERVTITDNQRKAGSSDLLGGWLQKADMLISIGFVFDIHETQRREQHVRGSVLSG
ncbi:MAG: hypothetical protein ACKV2Q_28630, partial [Planctomycetaceae bacterium]